MQPFYTDEFLKTELVRLLGSYYGTCVGGPMSQYNGRQWDGYMALMSHTPTFTIVDNDGVLYRGSTDPSIPHPPGVVLGAYHWDNVLDCWIWHPQT